MCPPGDQQAPNDRAVRALRAQLVQRRLVALIAQKVAQGHELEDVIQQLEATGKSLDHLRKDVEKGVDLFNVTTT